MCRHVADTKFGVLIIYFPKILRTPSVILRTAVFSVEVLTQELLNTKQEYQ